MKRALLLGLLAAVLVAAPVGAQESEDFELVIDNVDQSDFPTVVLTVTVPSEMNGLDLTPANFFVSEDGRGVGLSVNQLPVEELAVALLVDTSGSMNGAPMAEAKQAMAGFLDVMPADVEVGLVGFGNTSEILVDFTTNRDELQAGIAALDPGGETALYDGLITAAESLPRAERRTILLLTDGADTISEANLEDSLVALIGSGARLLIVELESPESDRTTLNRLEAATGGQLVAASEPDVLQGIYADVASNLINQYELTFDSFAEGATEIVVAVRTAESNAVGAATVSFPILPPSTTTTSSTTLPPTTTTRAPFSINATPFDVDVPFFATTTGLAIGAAAVFAALALVLLLLLPQRRRASDALGAIAALSGRARPRGKLSELTSRATLFAEDTLTRGGNETGLRLKLDRAGLALREGEFALIVFSVVAVVGVGGFLFLGPLFAIGGAIAVILLSISLVNYLAKRRSDKFRLQLPDTLQLISGSLRAGFGLNQALSAVASEQPAPTSEEFSRAQLEVHLGRDVEDALRNMAVRTQSEDMPWVAEAIEIHREIGGDVADLLDQIAATVRERERIRGQIQVLSAEGKVSGIVLVTLPFVIAGLTFSVAPDYLGELTSSTPGRIMLAAGIGAMIIGIFWIRRIVTLEF